MNDTVFLLTHQEFALLLAAAGVRRIHGFDLQPEEPDREASLQMLQRLSQRGFLTVCGDRFELAGGMKEIFGQMKDAESVMEVHKASGRSCLLYLGRGCVRLSASLRRANILELQYMETSNVWEWLKEEGWIPEGGGK